MKRWFAFGTIALFFAALPYAAFAKDNSQKEVATAHAHALMAAGADSLKMTHAHLHHVINCLVGPNGAGFDAAAADPCKGMGDGALPDAAAQAKLHRQLEQALEAARAGVHAEDPDAAKKSASKAANLLKAAAAGAKSR